MWNSLMKKQIPHKAHHICTFVILKEHLDFHMWNFSITVREKKTFWWQDILLTYKRILLSH